MAQAREFSRRAKLLAERQKRSANGPRGLEGVFRLVCPQGLGKTPYVFVLKIIGPHWAFGKAGARAVTQPDLFAFAADASIFGGVILEKPDDLRRPSRLRAIVQIDLLERPFGFAVGSNKFELGIPNTTPLRKARGETLNRKATFASVEIAPYAALSKMLLTPKAAGTSLRALRIGHARSLHRRYR